MAWHKKKSLGTGTSTHGMKGLGSLRVKKPKATTRHIHARLGPVKGVKHYIIGG